MQAERNVLSAYKALFMKQFVGKVMSATVCSTSKKGFQVELHEYPIICIHDPQMIKLGKDFTYDEQSFTWHRKSQKQKLSLGTIVDIKITHTSVIEGEVYMKLNYL